MAEEMVLEVWTQRCDHRDGARSGATETGLEVWSQTGPERGHRDRTRCGARGGPQRCS